MWVRVMIEISNEEGPPDCVSYTDTEDDGDPSFAIASALHGLAAFERSPHPVEVLARALVVCYTGSSDARFKLQEAAAKYLNEIETQEQP